MNYIQLTPENLEKEHICCAISNNRDPQTASKKTWLSGRFAEGLVFRKAEERGKCFIEYMPAENAWAPIDADGYMHINCFWVSGRFKGRGYGDELLEACIRDSKEKGRLGICVISSPQKMPFLSDPKYLAYKGFMIADTAEPYFTLLDLPFDKNAPLPKFKPWAKQPQIDEGGFVLYYSPGCPFTAKYAPLMEAVAKDVGLPFQSVRIDSREKAQAAPTAWTNYALFYNGKFITNEILSGKKFLKLVEALSTVG